jgi:hypothetical protein
MNREPEDPDSSDNSGGRCWRKDINGTCDAIKGVQTQILQKANEMLDLLRPLNQGGAADSDADADSDTELNANANAVVTNAAGEITDNGVIERCCEAAHGAVFDKKASASEKRMVQRLLEFLYYTRHTTESLRACVTSLRNVDRVQQQHKPHEDVADDHRDQEKRLNEDIMSSVARFSPQSIEDANKVQQLLMYILNCLHQMGYRRYNGGECYAVRFTEDNLCTYAWRRVCTIKEFVYQKTQKELNFDMWLNLTSVRTNINAVVDHLTCCRDVQFPDLVRDRHVFSFRGGVYFAATDTFVPYDKMGERAGGEDVVAAKFFDLDFPCADEEADEDWQPPTPFLQSILDFQKMGPEASWWMYVFIGRLIYEVGERDEWQVLPYLKGAASTGKSTILTRVCREIYEPHDVGVLSNNIEKKFGLSALDEKLIFIGPEIKSDIALEQAEFQSVVSGETVQVAVKYATARTIQWKVPGILAGNEVPGWVDNSGSINRRIVLFEFDHCVTRGDMLLGQKLAREMGCILRKTNRSYLKAVRLYARDNVWLHLPTEFHRAKDELSESVNSMVSLLRSGRLTFHPEMYMPYVDFMETYKDYCRTTGHRAIAKGDFKSHLKSMECVIINKTTLRYPRGAGGAFVANAKFVMGVDLSIYAEENASSESSPLE